MHPLFAFSFKKCYKSRAEEEFAKGMRRENKGLLITTKNEGSPNVRNVRRRFNKLKPN